MNISRSVSPPDLKINLPITPNIEIQNLLLGYDENQYSYVTPLSTDSNGRISGGETRNGTYKTYDFGYSVANTSNVAMRVYFHLIQIDEDGYTISDYHVWQDVEAGEKRRIWAGFRFPKIRDFHPYKIKEIHIGKTPNNRKDGSHWIASTTVNASLYHTIGLDKVEDNESKKYLVVLFIVVIAMLIMLNECS